MWKSRLEQIDPQTTRITFLADAQALSYRRVIDLWQTSSGFREAFTAEISASPFDAFFWETPPVTRQTFDRPFEFVLIASAALVQLRPDPAPFRSHFATRAAQSVLSFPNLGGDALLVVPAPLGDHANYTHLARFLRHGPKEQVDAFWMTVGRAMEQRISERPTWLSTAGLGVSWLHLRLDSRPKYFRHDAYRAASA